MARGKVLSDFEIWLAVGAEMTGASVTKTAQLSLVSVRTVTKVTCAFRLHLMTVMLAHWCDVYGKTEEQLILW